MTQLQIRVITALRRHAGKRNKVDVAVEAVTADVGGGVTLQDVHVALRDLMDDGFFLERPFCDGRSFRGRLPS
jgi:hypothetical protein